jgi:hypothetical protein
MMHSQRCSQGCRHFVSGTSFPAGACKFAGVICRLDPKVREWIDVRGCAVFQAIRTGIIDADTRSEGEIESDAREAAGDRKYHEMREGMD